MKILRNEVFSDNSMTQKKFATIMRFYDLKNHISYFLKISL